MFSKNTGIKNINVKFEAGKVYGIVGYNGAGKTTFLRCVEGLYIPTSGNVYHDKTSTADEKKFWEHRMNIAFLPADDYLYTKLTCIENIELATILRTGKKEVAKATKELISYFEADTYLDKKFGDCSTGMKKKIQIIISLIGDVKTIIWDEPNDGLDILTNIKIKKLIRYYKDKNLTILLSSHVVEFLEDCIDFVILMKDGEVIEQLESKSINSLEELYVKYLNQSIIDVPFTSEVL
jgi:ABC-type multidrug transport system ATPase subunit